MTSAFATEHRRPTAAYCQDISESEVDLRRGGAWILSSMVCFGGVSSVIIVTIRIIRIRIIIIIIIAIIIIIQLYFSPQPIDKNIQTQHGKIYTLA